MGSMGKVGRVGMLRALRALRVLRALVKVAVEVGRVAGEAVDYEAGGAVRGCARCW
ncbi:hypothetical protein GCM10010211_33140 [Streptomyces albospinus]|uniref:Uncharacterized protein n=1 Tax=Streptomyces albospinus TaxID=285515 RepID=A0ABQ2V232_9ACTN|nr:hypothetical protein GCM10010211_33140 [Streptomyces albospinus]